MKKRSKSELEIFSKSFQKDVKFFKNMSQKRERGKRLKSGSPGTLSGPQTVRISAEIASWDVSGRLGAPQGASSRLVASSQSIAERFEAHPGQPAHRTVGTRLAQSLLGGSLL